MLVLLVDDDRTVGYMVQYWLENSGMYCLYAPSSEEAVKLLDRRFDVVVQDVARGEDGYAGLAFYRDHLQERAMPVIFLTAYREQDLMLGGPRCHYLEKPARKDELLEKIREVTAAVT